MKTLALARKKSLKDKLLSANAEAPVKKAKKITKKVSKRTK